MAAQAVAARSPLPLRRSSISIWARRTRRGARARRSHPMHRAGTTAISVARRRQRRSAHPTIWCTRAIRAGIKKEVLNVGILYGARARIYLLGHDGLLHELHPQRRDRQCWSGRRWWKPRPATASSRNPAMMDWAHLGDPPRASMRPRPLSILLFSLCGEYASAFLARSATPLSSAPARRLLGAYQMDPANTDEALLVELDLAGRYRCWSASITSTCGCAGCSPFVRLYRSVQRYTMIMAAGNGWLDGDQTADEPHVPSTARPWG